MIPKTLQDEFPEEVATVDDLLVWILSWSELAAFGVLLTAFAVVAALHPAEVAVGRARLHPVIPVINTVVLLGSGWCAAIAAAERNMLRQRLALSAAAAAGFAFVILKLLEYRLEGATLIAEDAFSTLYVLTTGFHLAHVLFGSLILALLARYPSPQNIHMMTTLWHVIDIVWLVMLPVVYLI